MKRRNSIWPLLATLVLPLALLCAPAGADEPEAKEDSEPEVKVIWFRGRLPAFYKDVVTEEQRDEIYQIQRDYVVKIKELEEQLKQLKQQRQKEVEAVLTDVQRAKVAELAAQAKAERERKKQEDQGDAPAGDEE